MTLVRGGTANDRTVPTSSYYTQSLRQNNAFIHSFITPDVVVRSYARDKLLRRRGPD
jgi:hypothetical protein